MGTAFIKKIFIRGTIETLTGLHISSFNDNYSLGILDYTIVRDPVTHQPFIPGSTLKGKLRALLEEGIEQKTPDASEGQSSTLVSQLFGISLKHTKTAPCRIIFRDACMTKESLNISLPFSDLPYTEIKKELFINRSTGKATPTLIERIPAGIFFSLEIILNVYENDPEQDFVKTLFAGLEFLQDDYLGGRGSRGYGAIKIHLNSITVKGKEQYSSGQNAVPCETVAIPESLK